MPIIHHNGRKVRLDQVSQYAEVLTIYHNGRTGGPFHISLLETGHKLVKSPDFWSVRHERTDHLLTT